MVWPRAARQTPLGGGAYPPQTPAFQLGLGFGLELGLELGLGTNSRLTE